MSCLHNLLTWKTMALCLPAPKSPSVEQQTPGGTLGLRRKGGEAGAQEEEADRTAHEHDLVVGSLSGIYDRKKRLLV